VRVYYRVCFLIVMLLFWCAVPAAAALPVNADSIAAAQEYGKSNADRQLNEFLQPWTVYEEKVVKLDETVEHAYVYTPFLLLAADARDKTLNSQTISKADAEKILTDYNGYIIFGVVVFGGAQDFADKLVIAVKQGKKTVLAHQESRPAKAEKAAWSPAQNPVYACHAYFYFKSKDIAIDMPLVLQISGNGVQDRRFNFDLGRYK
jgi:hypothetical protein